MFQSATLKLTGWYLLILMATSVLFSAAIYQVTTFELGTRLSSFQSKIEFQPDFIPRPIDALRTAEATEAQYQIIIRLVYANILVLIAGGVASYFLARRTLRPIEVAHEAQSRFTSDASHELRTPLASMKAELEVALRDKSTSKKEYITVLKSNLEEVEKLSQLSEMLLNLSRLEHDKLERSAVDLVDVTKSAIERFNQPKGRVIVKPTKHGVIEANEAAITELVTILIDNALKYSPTTSLVTITLSRTAKQATFTIHNEGPGIEKDKLPYIFDRFYRADTSRTHQTHKGFGLGLSLAKKIVELHNGELHVTSEPFKQTVFSFSLPLSQHRLSKT